MSDGDFAYDPNDYPDNSDRYYQSTGDEITCYEGMPADPVSDFIDAPMDLEYQLDAPYAKADEDLCIECNG